MRTFISRLIVASGCLLGLANSLFAGDVVPKTIVQGAPLQYKIGFLGIPSSVTQFEMSVPVPWTRETVGKLKQLGFNVIQLNVAWGRRPGDEPLNLEDVVQLTPEQDREYPQVVPLRCRPEPAARAQRRSELRARIALCREAGLRTIFHFGAPYNAHGRYGDGPPNCLMDEKVTRRHQLLIATFAREFPGVDDLLVYTYDQDAWLCSEFGPCPRCLGIPLHQRLVPFLDSLSAAWSQHQPEGRLWWEPWELSAGQVLACVERVNPRAFGLALHCNIAEVMSTLPVDRWLKNTMTLARQKQIPAVVEYFLGAASEEVESFYHLAHPLVVLRGLRAIASVPGVVGIKEYYGLNPMREDPNLRMTSLFFHNPAISETEALLTLAKPYGKARENLVEFWKLTSEGMEFFPFETSWFIREVGRSRTDHSLSAAMLRGQQAHTPSWTSSRHGLFMKTDNTQPDPWMLEDVQLRCQLAADHWQKALALAEQFKGTLPVAPEGEFARTLTDLAGLRRRALVYALHLRETNLATVLRKAAELKLPLPQGSLNELIGALEADLENHRDEIASKVGGRVLGWSDMETALALAKSSPEQFLERYFKEEPNKASKGSFSVTSR